MPTLYRRISYVLRRFLRGVLRSNDSSRQIASGVALGMFIAFTPTMGFQLIIAALIATLLKCSRIPAMAMVYITNPFTAIPIYGTSYALGAALLRPFGFKPLRLSAIRNLFVHPEDLGPWEAIYSKLLSLFALGGETFASLWIGCTVMGAAAAVVSYYVALRFVTGHRLIKAERMARRARRRLERIRMEQALERAQSQGERDDE